MVIFKNLRIHIKTWHLPLFCNLIPPTEIGKRQKSVHHKNNKYIIDTLKDLTKKEVITQEDLGYNSDSKEAVAFAILGYLTLNGKPGNVKSATGAKETCILGNIYYGKKKRRAFARFVPLGRLFVRSVRQGRQRIR